MQTLKKMLWTGTRTTSDMIKPPTLQKHIIVFDWKAISFIILSYHNACRAFSVCLDLFLTGQHKVVVNCSGRDLVRYLNYFFFFSQIKNLKVSLAVNNQHHKDQGTTHTSPKKNAEKLKKVWLNTNAGCAVLGSIFRDPKNLDLTLQLRNLLLFSTS